MNVDLYERMWMWLATALIVVFVATIAVTTGVEAIQPTSRLETIDPEAIDANPEFGSPKVTIQSGQCGRLDRGSDVLVHAGSH